MLTKWHSLQATYLEWLSEVGLPDDTGPIFWQVDHTSFFPFFDLSEIPVIFQVSVAPEQKLMVQCLVDPTFV